jgi:hypothetical protein
MTPKSNGCQRLVCWFGQERGLLRSKGIDDADPRAVMDAVMRRHLAEIKSDPALQSSQREAHYLKLHAGNASQVRSIGAEIVSNRYKSGIDDDFLTTLHKRPPCMILEPSLISISSDFSSFEKLPERARDNIASISTR